MKVRRRMVDPSAANVSPWIARFRSFRGTCVGHGATWAQGSNLRLRAQVPELRHSGHDGRCSRGFAAVATASQKLASECDPRQTRHGRFGNGRNRNRGNAIWIQIGIVEVERVQIGGRWIQEASKGITAHIRDDPVLVASFVGS